MYVDASADDPSNFLSESGVSDAGERAMSCTGLSAHA
jgi:hypothetical protein